MKKRILILFLLLCSITATVQAQFPVNVTVQLIPPYSTRLSDYANNPGKAIILLRNTQQRALTVYLRANIVSDNGVQIFTNPNFRASRAITLQPNIPYTLNIGDLQDVFDVNQLSTRNITIDDIERKNGLPEGIYQVCVRAYDFTRQTAPLSAESPLGCTTVRLTQLEPPILIKPFEDEEVRAFQPQNIIFTWSPSAGAAAGTQYRLKIIELFDQKRNPNDAFFASTQPPFFEKTVSGNVFVFGPADPQLVVGRKYAWAVTALDQISAGGRNSKEGTAFRNGGRSEVRAFIYKETNMERRVETPVAVEVKKKESNKNTTSPKVKFTVNKDITDLFSNVFKGKLTWAFRKSEVGNLNNTGLSVINSIANANYTAKTGDFSTYETPKSGGFANASANSSMPKAGDFNKNSGTIEFDKNLMGGGSTQFTFGNSAPFVPVTLIKTAQMIHQERILAIADNKHYPLSKTKISVYLRKKPNSSNNGNFYSLFGDANTTPSEILIGQTKTNVEGEFSLSYFDKIPDGYEVFLKIQNTHFEYADYEIPIVKGENGTYDLGEMLGIAKTYRLKIKIVDDEGKKLDMAKVSIERAKGYYNQNPTNTNLKHEVLKDEYTGKPEELVGEGIGNPLFPRVFLSDGNADNYNVIITGDGIKKTTYVLNVLDLYGMLMSNIKITYANEEEVMLVEKTYKANLANPVFEGRVVTKQGEIPIAGAEVRIYPKNIDTAGEVLGLIFGLAKLTTTDSLGKFRIENVLPYNEPYEVAVRYKGKETIDKKPLLLTQKGITEKRDPIYIEAELLTVIGKVVDAKGNPLKDVTLTWKSGGKAFYSDENGKFMTSQVAGKHQIIAKRPGYKDTQQVIEVKIDSKTGAKYDPKITEAKGIEDWSNKVGQAYKDFGTAGQNIPKDKPKEKKGDTFTPILPLYPTDETMTFYDIFGDGLATNEVSSGHIITMTKFFVKATITDATTQKPIKDAIVSVGNSVKTFQTNSNGIAIVEDVSEGSPSIIVAGPEGSFYTTVNSNISISVNQDTIPVIISLKAGSKATGKVLAGGNAISNAEITVDGLEFIKTKTDAQGNYTLSGVPIGEYTLRASKEGFLAESKTNVFEGNKAYTIDFELKDPGFNATKLLGFKMVLYKSAPGNAPNEFVISGELRDLPDNPLFKVEDGANLKLKFSDKTIIKDGDKIFPKENEFLTDVSEIKLKAFDYLSIKLTSTNGIKIRPLGGNDKTQGEIYGEAVIDIGATFSSLSGWKLPDSPIKLQTNSLTSITAITSNGALAPTNFGLGGSSDGWDIYGVKLVPDLPKCQISADGISLKGKLTAEKIALIGDISLNLNQILISKQGEIKTVDINLTPQPSFSLATWKLKIADVGLNQYGLKFSGDMDLPIPSSETAKIGFKNLSVSTKSLIGGTFILPKGGIDIFGLVKFETAKGTEFTLQKLAGTNHYNFIGAGTISLPKYISEKIELNNFSIATNGAFAVNAKTDFSVDFAGMANLKITQLGFNSATTAIDLGGEFKLKIPNLGLGAASVIHYKKGSAPSIDELGLSFNLAAAIALQAKVKFKENEFAGSGFLKIANAVDGVGLDFFYRKKPAGLEVGALFKLGVVIPIGVVKLDNLHGGFDFDFAENIYSINAGGRITAAPDPQGVVALDPVDVKITSTPQGPIFDGSATVRVIDTWNIGKATMKLDFAAKQFYIDGTFGQGFNLIKGIGAESNAGVHLELNTGAGNYWFVAGYTSTKIAYIFDAGVTIAAGWNVPKYVHSSLSGIPDYVLTNGKLYGGYFGTFAKIGGNSPNVDFLGLAGLKGWYKNESMCEVYANFKSNAYGFKMGQSWSAGGSAYMYDLGDVASASLSISGDVSGYYNGSWGLNGTLKGSASAHLGCDGGCNGITWGCCVDPCPIYDCEFCPCPCGVKICADASVKVSYTSQSGFDFDLDLF